MLPTETAGTVSTPVRAQGDEVALMEVAKTFRTAERVTHAVDDVSFTAGRSEFVSLIGPSGCGKTTVMKMVGDLLAPTSGTITIGGGTTQEARKARKLGFVFQEATLLGWRTLIDNVALPLEVLREPKSVRHERAGYLLDLVGLAGFENHYPDQVSGGMQQRASIARALSFSPSVLLMDEPFGALDLITRDRMCFELLRIWEEERKTVLFVTHSITEAVLLSDKVAIFSSRPSRIREYVEIDLPRPRTVEMRDDPRFHEYVREFRAMLEG